MKFLFFAEKAEFLAVILNFVFVAVFAIAVFFEARRAVLVAAGSGRKAAEQKSGGILDFLLVLVFLAKF